MNLHRYPALLIALGATFNFCTAQAQSTNTMVEQGNRGN